MSRPTRIEYPGAYYHVMNRGNRRETIFHNKSDYELFLKKLSMISEKYGVEIHSYCILPNHFHLYLCTQDANLGRFMQSFLTSFTTSMNIKYDSSGHLFQGRYKAKLVENRKYRNAVTRYIHLNAMDVKGIKTLTLKEKRDYLKNYQWSSYPAHIGLAKRPSWLESKVVLSSWGANNEERMKNYRRYVEQGLTVDCADELNSINIVNILGSESFAEKITRTYLLSRETDLQLPELNKLISAEPSDIISKICKFYKLQNESEILERKNCHKTARQMALYLICKHCCRKYSMASIAEMFHVQATSLPAIKALFEDKLTKDETLVKEYNIIEKATKI